MADRFDARHARMRYLTGFASALALTLAAYAVVAYDLLPRGPAIAAIGGLATVQVVVHLWYFLHLDLSKSKREDLQLVLFATLLITLMVGGSLWVMWNLATRM